MGTKNPEAATPKGKEARKRRFAQAYALHHNGARAAKEAGYSAKRAKQTAVELKEQPDVMAMIDEERAKIDADHRQDVKEITSFDPLAKLAKLVDKILDMQPAQIGMPQARLVEFYIHARDGTPEAKKIMADIQNRVPAGTNADNGDFTPGWAKRVN